MARGRDIELPRIASMMALGAGKGLPFTVRTAVPSDVKFIDALQKRFSNEVGFLPLAALDANIVKNRIAIGFENDEPAGYILGKPNYKGDPELAILYQCAIEYSAQRHMLGSSLLEHAVGLFPPPSALACAWVAQDIEANFFWEACGFEPIAARRGSKRKGRVHIFWQRRIDPRNKTVELRHPDMTHGGLMREKRIVVPIEAGDAWKKLKPEDFPEPAPSEGDGRAGRRQSRRSGRAGKDDGRKSPDELRRRFLFGVSDWMWVIINGVGRYLPVVNELEVPGFMDQPGAVVVQVPGQVSAAVPRSRIPGL